MGNAWMCVRRSVCILEENRELVLGELLGKLPQNPFDVIMTERDFVVFCMKRCEEQSMLKRSCQRRKDEVQDQ